MELLGQTRFPCSSDPSDKSLRDPSVPWTLFFGNSHLLLVVLAGTDGVFRTYHFQVGHGFVDIYNHFFFFQTVPLNTLDFTLGNTKDWLKLWYGCTNLGGAKNQHHHQPTHGCNPSHSCRPHPLWLLPPRNLPLMFYLCSCFPCRYLGGCVHPHGVPP